MTVKDDIHALATAMDTLSEEFERWEAADDTMAAKVRELQDQIAEIQQKRAAMQDQLADRLDGIVPGWRGMLKALNKKKARK